jgi:signal transduction histidine kinase
MASDSIIYTERIFNVFERLHSKDAYEGTGLGLALCRKIAERHNGTLTAAGRPGQGADFTLTLPLLQLTEKL